MAPRYDGDLLDAADLLLTRRAGQRGRLPTARIRRSVSTSYYALFHFLLEEVGMGVVGAHGGLRRRRRMLARSLTHRGVRATLGKVQGARVDASVAEFLRPRGGAPGPVAPPRFVRDLASVFADAQAKRHDADYDLNAPFSEADGRLLHARVKAAIAAWRDATSVADRDFKGALCVLMLLKGQLRGDA